MMLRLPFTLALVLSLFGCNETTTLETLTPTTFDVVSQEAAVELAATPSFADERGGGVFVDLAGRVVRVRANGERGVLESHPQNLVLPGPAIGVHALGPSNALVATSRGFFVADQGWLIAPAWQSLLPAEGLLETTVGGDGVAWLAHTQGLYRVAGGALLEFKLADASLANVTALATAPTLGGPLGVWFAHDGKLYSATPTSSAAFSVTEATLGAALGTGVTGLVGLTPTRKSSGELWAITDSSLLLFDGNSWRQYQLPASPRRLLGAGRFAWLQAGDALYRYDGDSRVWSEAKGLTAAGALLSVDAAGNAWVRVGEKTMSISPRVVPRVLGMFESSRVFDGQLLVQTELPESMEATVTWRIDDDEPKDLPLTDSTVGTGPMASLRSYNLGGFESNGTFKPISFASLEDGWHTLEVTAKSGEASTTRKVAFEFLGSETASVSWANDIASIARERCDKCHTTGTEPELASYEQWKANAASIAAAVRDSRMPADGPLTSAGVALIVRWANGGELP